MSKLRLAAYDRLSKVAEAAGFRWVRCVGTHNTFRNDAGQIVTIPDHGSHVIVRPLLRRLLRDMGLTVDAYHRLLDEV